MARYFAIANHWLFNQQTKAQRNFIAILFYSQDESSYVLKEALTTANLIDFVHNFTMKKLTRHLRHDNHAKHSHFYKATKSQVETDKNGVNRKVETVSIAILSAENFSDIIFDPHRVSVCIFKFCDCQESIERNNIWIFQSVAVLFSSSQCAFCTIFSSVLLTIARILKDADYVKFARIDSDKNDLPWQFTMETVPAFIIFNE